MGTENITPIDIETLSEVAARLSERAEQISDRHTMNELAADLRIAASCARRLSALQAGMLEIADRCLSHPEWDSATHARDIRILIEGGE